MLVGIHQPNFIPWLGFFEKLRKSDVFVFLDEVQYTKNHVFNRNMIIGNVWLTIPVIHESTTIYKDVRVDNTKRWKKKHFNSFMNYSKKSANYHLIDEFCSEVYKKINSKNLIDYNVASIKFVMKHFNIKTKCVFQSELGLPNSKGTQALIDIVREVGGDKYLSGKGALKKTESGGPAYLETKYFTDIKLEVLEYAPPHNFSALHHLIIGEKF